MLSSLYFSFLCVILLASVFDLNDDSTKNKQQQLMEIYHACWICHVLALVWNILMIFFLKISISSLSQISRCCTLPLDILYISGVLSFTNVETQSAFTAFAARLRHATRFVKKSIMLCMTRINVNVSAVCGNINCRHFMRVTGPVVWPHHPSNSHTQTCSSSYI